MSPLLRNCLMARKAINIAKSAPTESTEAYCIQLCQIMINAYLLIKTKIGIGLIGLIKLID